jgi:DNA-directed RNA polymerase specialized sigma24 family protein
VPRRITTMADDSARMRQVLDKLSKDERLVCIWKLAGFPTRDIARHLKRSESAIDALYARAKGKVRHLLAEQGPDE